MARAAGPPDAPRATLILLAHEQERFVEAAVASALAQDYPNLEIILSDHGSRDGTFAAMERIARAYDGPHQVHLRRGESQLGVLGHALEAAEHATGDLVVAAAGDDVQRPQRVSRLVSRWRESGAAVLFSASDAIDEDGRPAPADQPSAGAAPIAAHSDSAAAYFPGRAVPALHGAAAAYDRQALAAIAAPDFPVMVEDVFLTMMLALRGARFAYVDEPLLLWRRHARGLSRPAGTLPPGAQEAAIRAHSAAQARILRHVEAAATSGAGFRTDWGAPAAVDLPRLRADAAFHEALSTWSDLSFARRLRTIAAARSPAHRRSLLPRLFGTGVLTALKRLRA